MAKVYLSFLGTSDYVPCNYYREKVFQAENIRFVQEATIRFSCRDWSSTDRILMFTTEEACKKNWGNNGHIDHKTGKHPILTGLKDCLSGIKLPCSVTRVDIPAGKSEAEIWEIFNIVFEAIKQGDEVIFDITHAFRSIPMLAMVILNYAKVMKDITLTGIYYGAFEVLGNPYEVKHMPLEERNVPIFDLTAFDQLLDWSVAIDRFVEAGDAGLIKTLARGGLKQILTETKGKDRNAAAIRNIGDTLDAFCATMATCREAEISSIAEKLKSQMRQCESTDLLPPFKPLFRLLGEKIASFNGNRFSDGISAANWCFEHNLIQQAATILREVVVSYFVSRMEGDEKDSEERQIAAKAINIAYDNMFNKKLIESQEVIPEDTLERIEDYLQICDKKPALVKTWGSLVKLRNDLNHAGYVNDPKKSAAFSTQLPDVIAKLQTEI